jgi:hypothetical protein
MARILKVGLALALLVFVFAGNTQAQEKHVKKSDLPAAVQKRADEESKGATVRGYSQESENGKVEYEVEMMVNGHSRDVSMDAEGNVLEVEESVPLDRLPNSVRDGLQKKAGPGKITKVESITKQGKLVAYEAHGINGAKKFEVQVGPEGQTLDHEE